MRFIFFLSHMKPRDWVAAASMFQFVVTRCGFALGRINQADTCHPAHLLWGEATGARERETLRTQHSGNLCMKTP